MSPLGPTTPATVAAEANVERAQLRRAAEGFEAIFIRRMLEAARAADFGDEGVIGGSALDQYTAMRDEHLAEIAAARGTFGIAAAIEAQLARHSAPTQDS